MSNSTMDAGRLQGWAVARVGNLSCIPPENYEQQHHVQLGPSSAGRLNSALTPGPALLHQRHHGGGGPGKPRRRKCNSVIRAAIPHDLAAVAVAAATVLPMCWMYINRSQISTISSSESVRSSANSSFAGTAHEKKSSAAAANAATSTIVAPTVEAATAEVGHSSSTIRLSNGAVHDEEIQGVLVGTKVHSPSSIDVVVEDQWLATFHETLVASVASVDEGDIRSGEGSWSSLNVAPSPAITWFDQSVHDSAGRTLPAEPADPANPEVTGFFQDWNSYVSSNVCDEPDVNEHRANSGSQASTAESSHGKVNGHKVEGAHTNPAEVDISGSESLLPSGRDELVPNDSTYTLDSSLNPNSTCDTSAIKVNGTSFTRPPEQDHASLSKDDFNLTYEIGHNGSLNGSSTSRPVHTDSSDLDDRVEESLVVADEDRAAYLLGNENERKMTAYGDRIDDGLQSTPGSDRIKIDEKRAELAKIISNYIHIDLGAFRGKVNDRRQPNLSLESALASASETTSATELKKEHIRSSGRTSNILPLKASLGSEFYLKTYEKLLRAGRVRDSIVLLEEMEKLKMFNSGKIYHGNFFRACQKQKAVREAFRFLRLLSRPTLSSYNMLLCVCRDARDVDGGLRVLSAAENAGLKPDGILYTTLISTCAKAGKVDIAFKVYHDMEAAGLKPTIETYGAMIDGCARAGQIAKAFGVYGIMISKNLKPDHVIFNTLINACGRAGAIERAFDVLADMKGEPFYLVPNHVTIGALISACARAGQMDQAFEVYRDMRSSGIEGTPECYTAAVHACSPTGDLDLALTVFEEMKTDGVKPDEIFFSSLIDVAGHSQNVDAAFRIMDEMKKISVIPGAITFSALMGVCCNTGNWERGLELYRKVRAADFRPSVSTFNALITALCDGKQIEQSFTVFQEMKEAGVQPDQITYSILLDACEKLDEAERAFDLYTTGRAEGVVPNEAMCSSVIAICYARIKKKHRSTSYPSSIGLLSGQTNEAPYEQWASWAIAVYRHAVAANVFPTIKSLSLLLGCLRIPEASHEKRYLSDETVLLPNHLRAFRSTSPSLSPTDCAGIYDPRALALFEEAASMGVVPSIKYTAGPITVNAQSMPSYVAEVYLLLLLKGLKQRHLDGQQLFPITVFYSTETKQIVVASTNKVTEIKLSDRTGQGVAALFRRLRLHFHGHESSGKLKIETASIRKWLKPTTAFPPLQRHQELGPFGPPHTFLGQGIAEQQRNIRMAEVYKDSADIQRVSGVDMYKNRRRISQAKSWDRGGSSDFDFTDRVNGSTQRPSRRGAANKRRP